MRPVPSLREGPSTWGDGAPAAEVRSWQTSIEAEVSSSGGGSRSSASGRRSSERIGTTACSSVVEPGLGPPGHWRSTSDDWGLTYGDEELPRDDERISHEPDDLYRVSAPLHTAVPVLDSRLEFRRGPRRDRLFSC